MLAFFYEKSNQTAKHFRLIKYHAEKSMAGKYLVSIIKVLYRKNKRPQFLVMKYIVKNE